MYGSDADDAAADETAGDSTVGSADLGEPVVEPAVAEALATTGTAADARLEGVDRADRPDRIASILVAVGPGPHSGAAVDLARGIAEATDAWLELFHVVPSEAALGDGDGTGGEGDGADAAAADATAVGVDADAATTGDPLLAAARDRLADFDRVDRWLVEDRTAAGAIVEQSPYYDLVVVGTPTTGTVGRFVFGSTTDTVVDESAVPVVVVEADGETSILEE
ncbi:universal stress protein [Halorubrum cibi]|uniref:Nucleotide-binding universal stress protein, UspA family n=1 Tax=Halorubrum cibi TaxID=413815 RepID=A0A521CPG1_9EURY|nr:universal stress protein [Halorubrum cibi]SMO61337.1 Nucleotide-binding universal stress protein, UspA family [Halorubrum cibi]